jgi:HEAT repeat protein
VGPEQRARDLLLRLETDGPRPLNAAEELDRLLGRKDRDEALDLEADPTRERAEALCAAWSRPLPRAERADAWLTLVGALNLKEHVPEVAAVLEDGGRPAPQRARACRVLARLRGRAAREALRRVTVAKTDPVVRAAAIEALGECGDREARPLLVALLEEDVPRGVWNAASAALERLRMLPDADPNPGENL